MICRLASLLLGTMPSPRLRLELVATISVSQGLARTGRLSVCALSHNTLNRISYWRALKSQIIHGGSSTIVLTVAFCSKDNSGGREGDTAKCLPIVCQLSHCSAASLCSAICGRAAHITACQTWLMSWLKAVEAQGKFFYFYLHSALLPPVLLLLPPPPLLPTLVAEVEEEGTAAACVEDVVAQSSEDFSVKKYKEKK